VNFPPPTTALKALTDADLVTYFAPNTNSAFTHLQSERQQFIAAFAPTAFPRRHDATPQDAKTADLAFHFMSLDTENGCCSTAKPLLQNCQKR
jgi:hypothetical protein